MFLLVLLMFRSDCARGARLGLKSDYAVKKVTVISSYIEHFFLLQLQSPNNILYSTFFFHFFTHGKFFPETYSLFSFTSSPYNGGHSYMQYLPIDTTSVCGFESKHRNTFTFLLHDLKVLRLCKFGSCSFLRNFLQ